MTSRDFCYWLQGYFEIRKADGVSVEPTPEMLETIEKHLALVFNHEIDPSMGPPEHQAVLDEIHHAKTPEKPKTKPNLPIGGKGPGGTLYRC